MRELDQLLVRYLDTRYAAASEADKQAFRELLELSDPELVGYLLNHQAAAPELQNVVNQILG
jgi:succinate dehydrogenase flavin-adding protein (antitoxin of CptAB toxin-antitoxin module)